MCGRYTIRRPGLLKKLSYQSEFDEFSDFHIQPRFSVAPTQPVPVIRRVDGDAPRAAMRRWGLIPYWTRGKPKHDPFNTRSETVATSGMFREPFERRRCLMVCDGFYEPKGKKLPRQAYFFPGRTMSRSCGRDSATAGRSKGMPSRSRRARC